MNSWEEIFKKKISEIATNEDPAHDLLHFERVVATAKVFCEVEKGNPHIIVPAAWLHDFVIVPKNSPLRSQASKIAAEKAIEYLKSVNYPSEFHSEIFHAIEAHSFSANIETKTLEAKIVQDADRLDGVGAIGIARCFATAALLKRPFYFDQDPFCEDREPNDLVFTVDHFYKKLFKTVETLKTESGKQEGKLRAQVMKEYLAQLKREIRAQDCKISSLPSR